MDFDLTLIIIDLMITLFSYLFAPILLSCIIKKKFTQKKLKWFAIANGVFVWFCFEIFYKTNGFEITANTAAAWIWSSVGYWIMKKNILKSIDDAETNHEKTFSSDMRTECQEHYTQKKPTESKKPKRKNFILFSTILLLFVSLSTSALCVYQHFEIEELTEISNKRFEQIRDLNQRIGNLMTHDFSKMEEAVDKALEEKNSK